MEDRAGRARQQEARPVEWASFNRDLLAHHEVYATGTTGGIPERHLGFEVRKLQSGPLGGDQRIGAKIVSKEIDFLIFCEISCLSANTATKDNRTQKSQSNSSRCNRTVKNLL